MQQISLYVFYPTPTTCAGCDTGSVFKWSLTGWEFGFPFPTSVSISRLKNTVCPTIYP